MLAFSSHFSGRRQETNNLDVFLATPKQDSEVLDLPVDRWSDWFLERYSLVSVRFPLVTESLGFDLDRSHLSCVNISGLVDTSFPLNSVMVYLEVAYLIAFELLHLSFSVRSNSCRELGKCGQVLQPESALHYSCKEVFWFIKSHAQFEFSLIQADYAA